MSQDRYERPLATVNEDLLEMYESDGQTVHRIYAPAEISIVMGAGRLKKNDLKSESVSLDSVPVYIRKGGGGTVVLAPGMVVLAFVTSVSHRFLNREYAAKINSWIVHVLEGMGVKRLQAKGISDLAIDERKILGSSLFRRQHILFYQASLLVANDLTLFTRYLTYPSTVPDYRNSRDHEKFCTTLAAEGYAISVRDVITALEEHVATELPKLS